MIDFHILYSTHYNSFIRYAYRYVRDMAVAEDCVTEAFMYYWENNKMLNTDMNGPAYILTSIKHKCLTHLRRLEAKEIINNDLLSDAQWELQSRISRLEYFEPSEIYTHEIKRLVNEVLQSLPERTREIFIMSRNNHLSHNEIAQSLNISTKSVEFHINKAIKVLRIKFKDYLPILLALMISK